MDPERYQMKDLKRRVSKLERKLDRLTLIVNAHTLRPLNEVHRFVIEEDETK